MRKRRQVIGARATSDGDGVRIQRVAGSVVRPLLDPFLMLDEIHSDEAADYSGGFPEHPHRGFETITYMKAGRMRHRDHMGNEGLIGPGDAQWMTAGAGVLHSEMPEQEDGLLHGFQVWLNLPAAEKMQPAAYRDVRAPDAGALELAGGGQVMVIAGELAVAGATVSGPVQDRSTRPLFADLVLRAGERVALDFNRLDPALVYVYDGTTGGIERGWMGVYEPGETLQLAAGEAGAAALLLSGRPLVEPIAQYGPFVMNTPEQIEAALRDYQAGRLVS